jgi:large subunit ribosomal protein L11
LFRKVVENLGEKKQVEALLAGGQATAGPPLGPILGPLGVNVLQIVNKINELTKAYAGMKVPVRIIVDVESKDFEIEVGTPTTSALIVKELGIEKGSGNPKAQKVGNLTMDQLLNIARMKAPRSYSTSLKGVVKEVLGACVSMGVTVEQKEPKEILREIDEGRYDKILSE